jgi:hypothetical protein
MTYDNKFTSCKIKKGKSSPLNLRLPKIIEKKSLIESFL